MGAPAAKPRPTSELSLCLPSLPGARDSTCESGAPVTTALWVDVTNSSPRTAREPGGAPQRIIRLRYPSEGERRRGRNRAQQWEGQRLGMEASALSPAADPQTRRQIAYPVPSAESQSFQETSRCAPRRGGTQAQVAGSGLRSDAWAGPGLALSLLRVSREAG